MDDVLLEVRGLRTHFLLDEGVVKAVDGADVLVRRGRTLAVVGESGCGKSVMARSILQIVPQPGRIVGGQIQFHRQADGQVEAIDITDLPPNSARMRAIRGRDISMIFQEPMASLSPVHTIGPQVAENFRLHWPVSQQEARTVTIEMLRKVGILRAEQRFDAYPHQLSGGMRQRAMIAMALICQPSLLIADEPTTALDVTTQAQILDLMQQLQQELGMAIIIITHDLGVVAEIADDVAVMYLGEVVEQAPVDAIFHNPQHPLHARCCARCRGWRARPTRGSTRSRRGAAPVQPPAGLPVPPALPRAPGAPAGDLQAGGARAAARQRQPVGALLAVSGRPHDRCLWVRTSW